MIMVEASDQRKRRRSMIFRWKLPVGQQCPRNTDEAEPTGYPTKSSALCRGFGACPGHRLTWRAVSVHEVDAAGDLPPLAPPEASDDERARAIMARFVARYGAPRLEDYRRAYAGCGVPWPGDEEIRRRHPVADSAA